MDWEDIGDWFIWGLFLLTFVVMALTAVMTLAAACREIYLHFVTRRRRKKQAQAPVPIEELLASIPDVPYQELPSSSDAAGAGGGGEEACVICAAPYEAGEPCSVLPPCTHVFHKACVAAWLRESTTCPLCRAAVALPAAAGRKKKKKAWWPRTSRQGGGDDVVSAAEDMV